MVESVVGLPDEQVASKWPKAMPSSSCEDSDIAFDLVFRWS